MTEEKKKRLIYLTEPQKDALAEHLHLRDVLGGLDADHLFAVWMIVGRMYGEQARREGKMKT